MQEEVINLLKKTVKNITTIALISGFIALTASNQVNAASSLAEEETKAYGTIAGAAYACKAPKLNEYEFIVKTIMKAKIVTNGEMNKALYDYAFAKSYSYRLQKERGIRDCTDVINRFNAQKIFSSVILKDGRIKTPDGVWLRPNKPYDVNDNR